MNLTFWNVNKAVNNDLLSEMIIENESDITAFAEYTNDAVELLRILSLKGYNYFHIPIIGCERINLFTKIPLSKIKHLSETGYYTIKSIHHPQIGMLLLVVVHLPSKLRADENEQFEEIKLLKTDIEKEEEASDSTNTIILGDFNMNPFEKGMLSAAALNAFPTKSEAKIGVRRVKERFYKTFYNPMWGFLGDKEFPLGTYYYSKAAHYKVDWNIFDQVLVRPNIMEYLSLSDLRILTSIRETSLINKSGKPYISDHLPICFKI